MVEENKLAMSAMEVNACCCCLSKGRASINTQVEKTAYTADETAKAIADIDNSMCKAAIEKVQVEMV